jgi:hypothetical protein
MTYGDLVTLIPSIVTTGATVVLAYYAWVTIEEGKKNRRKDTVERMLADMYSPIYAILLKAKGTSQGDSRDPFRERYPNLQWVLMRTQLERLLGIIDQYGHYFDEENEYAELSALLNDTALHPTTVDSQGHAFMFGFTEAQMSKHFDRIATKRRELRLELHELTLT